MSSGWTTEETRALVGVWGQANVQSELDGVTRNRSIYARISKELGAVGYEKTWQQKKLLVLTIIGTSDRRGKHLPSPSLPSPHYRTEPSFPGDSQCSVRST